jgi:aminomethyltransferase
MNLLATPFHTRVMACNRANAWTRRNGFTLAADYGDAAEEAVAARFGAVIADCSWRWRTLLSGEKAGAFVARLFTRNAAALGIGAAMEVAWLNDAGAVRGIGTVIRTATNEFLLDSTSDDGAWIAAAARLYGVTLTDRTLAEGALLLCGPAAAKILSCAGLDAGMPLLSWRTVAWSGLMVSVRRCALGFCITCQAGDASAVWDRLTTAGADYALLPAGLTALDVLEIENGCLSPGRDFVPAGDGFAAAPLPQALGLCDRIDRSNLFNGRAGVLAGGPDTVLGGVLLDGEVPPTPTALLEGDESTGTLLTAIRSPVLRRVIGLAVFTNALPKGPLTAGGQPCRAVPLPFLPPP